jgi:hypothetical protein
VRIDEVKNHIGEEWAAGRGSYNSPVYRGQRLRIEGVETVEKKRYGYRAATINKRYARVTILHRETGEVDTNLGAGASVLIEAKDLDQPWADYWAQTKAERERRDRRRAAVARLRPYLPDERFTTSWDGTTLSIDGMEALADLLEAHVPGTDEEG